MSSQKLCVFQPCSVSFPTTLRTLTAGAKKIMSVSFSTFYSVVSSDMIDLGLQKCSGSKDCVCNFWLW